MYVSTIPRISLLRVIVWAMTCAPDLAAHPAVLPDPDGEGKILYWSCCDRLWYLSPGNDAPHRTYTAWHFAAEALSTP
jgi:hypothetical protein